MESLSILITSISTFVIGTYVFVKNPRKIINISFFALVISAGLWSLALFVISIGARYEVLKIAGHMAFSAGALMGSNFLLFAYVFPEKRDEFPPLRIWLLIFVPGIFIAIAGLTPLIMKDIAYIDGRLRPVYGKWVFLQTLYAIIYSAAALFLLARKYLKHPGRFERAQLIYTFWGLLPATLGVTLFTLLLPVLGISQFSGPLTALVIIFSIANISYAIVRHRLMDLGVVFRSTLIYAGTVAILAGALIVLALLLMPALKLQLQGAVFLAVVIASLAVNPLRNSVQTLVDRYFFRGRYNYQAALTEFSHSMTKILDLEDLQNRIVHEVASILQVKSAAILLREARAEQYTVRAAIPVELGADDRVLDDGSLIIRRLNREHTLLVKDELKRALPVSEFKPLENEFDRMDAEVAIPLFYREELLGLLTLGEKISTDIYSVEDLNLLVTLGNQAAVALENALLHYTVTMLKNHNDNILKYMSSGVIAIDSNRIINTCNDKAREILRRLEQSEVMNKNIDLLPPPLRQMLIDTLAGTTRYSNHEVQILSSSGSITYLGASTSLIMDQKGAVIGALLVINDLTEIRLLEGEMWRADKLASLGTLAAGMAHEIKNPLVSIKTFAQLLPTRYEDKEFRENFSSIAVDEVERINSIVEKLLEFARPSAPLFEMADIIELIEEVLLLLSNECSKANVTIIRAFEVESAPIICDKSQFKQALLNLCLNALQSFDGARNNGLREIRISVALRKSRFAGGNRDQIAQMFYGTEAPASIDDAETALIKVRDTGRGISRKHLTKIFDPFFTTKEKGVGLGLAVVHGIIKEHSGNITVDSKENYGTEFTISLPVNQIFAKERT